MFIQLDISWLRHPFPVSSFRISQDEQIQTLQGLGVQYVRCIPLKSDIEVQPLLFRYQSQLMTSDIGIDGGRQSVSEQEVHEEDISEDTNAPPDLNCAPESEIVQFYDQRFSAATHQFGQILNEVIVDPLKAMQSSTSLVSGYIAEMLHIPQTAVRLLSETVGEQQEAHSINVTILALMLGKAWGLTAEQLTDLGLAALLHDVGKLYQPRTMNVDDSCVSTELRISYEMHVDASVECAQRMGLGEKALTAIAQHHETADGKGFPRKLSGDKLSVEGQILALTNCYDKMCNPVGNKLPLTPHEALSTLFAQRRGAYRRDLVEMFVRVMGVYPPGSIVQLNDNRYAIVISARSDIPLKPTVLVYQKDVDRNQSSSLDLSQIPATVIKRSLRPSQLSREVLDYLSPRKRVCYFFQRAVPLLNPQGNE